jgi:hypothetical protein
MTYAEQAATAANPGFNTRVVACSVQQAETFINDARPEFSDLARLIIRDSNTGAYLTPLVAAMPNMTVESEDPDLLAAVQAVWPVYGATLQEGTP